MTDWPMLVILFMMGAAAGSFLNVCIARWPKEESVVRPRSRCPRCGASIGWFDNIPVLSWLALRAKCRSCGQAISPIYPLVEATTGIIWVAAAWTFASPVVAVRVAVFATILFGVAVTDAKHYLIPDGFTLSGLLFGAAASVAGGLLGSQGPFAEPMDALFGACVGAGAITIIGWLGEVADVRIADGPDMIRSENARLSGWIYIDFRDRDIGSYVAAAQAAGCPE